MHVHVLLPVVPRIFSKGISLVVALKSIDLVRYLWHDIAARSSASSILKRKELTSGTDRLSNSSYIRAVHSRLVQIASLE